MAQLPQAEQTVFPEQGPLPQANGADFGAQVGAAQQGVGEQLDQVGDEAFQQAIKWQGLKNEATAQDLDVQFQGDLGKLEDNYYSLKGKAAADAYPGFQSDVTALRQKYLGTAPNPMVQNMLGQSVGYSVARSLRSAGQQAGEQTRAWMVDSGTSRIESLDYNATKRFNDQGLADETDKARDAAIDSLGQIQGWSADHIALAKQQSRDKLLADRQTAAQTYLKGQPVADVLHSLVGDSAATQGGPVGGAAYRTAVVATEFGSGQNNPNNPHQGPVQADDAWWAHFGAGGDRNNMKDALAALDRETAENQPKLEQVLGRKATDADLYLAHQQGLAGAIALLKNPTALASQSVPLANIAANVPAGTDPSTLTGQQFSDIWAKGFDQSGGIMAGNPASKNNQLDSAIAVLSDAQKMELTKNTIDAWHTQDTALYEDQQHQLKAAADAKKQQMDTADAGIQQMMLAHADDPTKPTVNVLTVAQSPLYADQPERVKGLIAFQKSLDHPPTDDGLDKATTQQLYRGILDGSVKADDVQAAFAPTDGSPGKISRANLDFLNSVLKGSDTQSADSKNTNALKTKFLSDNEKAIGGAAIDPDSKYRFDFDFQQAWAAKVAAGQNPKDLITPGNKDYFGNLSTLALYSQTAADKLQEQKDAQNPGLLSRVGTAISGLFGGEPIQAGVSIPPELPKGTTYFGKTKDGRDVFLRPDGVKVAEAAPTTPPPSAAPVAAAGPTVPSGE